MAKYNPTEIGLRLKQAREAVGMTQNALGVKMDPSPGRSWPGYVESGRIISPEVKTLKAAAVAMGISEEWLILGTGPMRKRKRPEAA